MKLSALHSHQKGSRAVPRRKKTVFQSLVWMLLLQQIIAEEIALYIICSKKICSTLLQTEYATNHKPVGVREYLFVFCFLPAIYFAQSIGGVGVHKCRGDRCSLSC
ncbi:hypothetical protein ATANTOWER_013734 [Ataeniobius toweri]|uniref:Uncharacterized protein n=1 Tax=Ataeniobius toweri TaxID=208326 RepID=A0ABU7CAI3_9TELE|nr:hypothetical protein [Ataeniobius toweri]